MPYERTRRSLSSAGSVAPRGSTKTYTTTWFDMWRFVDGKADEHWDGATKNLPF